MLRVRCSSLPLVAACAPAAQPPRVKVEHDDEPARLGTALHRFMAETIRGGRPDVDELAAAYQVKSTELAPMAYWTRSLWFDRLADGFPSPVVEEEMTVTAGGLTLTGHPDVLSVVGDEARGIDWKSGRLDSGHMDQVRGYGLLGFTRWPDTTAARMTVVDGREQRAQTYLWPRAELVHWFEWFAGHVAEADTYRPGEHCGRCRRQRECAAFEQATAQIVRVGTAYSLPSQSPADDLAVAVLNLRALKNQIEGYLELARAKVEFEGGSYGPLAIREHEEHPINFARGYPVLADVLGVEKLHELASVGKGNVLDAVKASAPRGQKASAAKEVMDRLDAAGAVETVVKRKLEVNRNVIAADDQRAEPVAIGPGQAG